MVVGQNSGQKGTDPETLQPRSIFYTFIPCIELCPVTANLKI